MDPTWMQEAVIYGDEDADINIALSGINIKPMTFEKPKKSGICAVS